ncbi:bacteriohemerythrin [Clostridium puniceum]|uniref:Bacteriohemerythrin n=1 Tax=Clostridium puniceum TaxID=29367 RepID=A0A1S8TW56_9CLOT|nr:bacteriohemerythrin [Clostridium puniceum]OOM81849.1 bacteriohemerythrin [Clostridium puniceum]
MGMKWEEKWSVGVDKIDTQHQELFNRIDQLVTAMKTGKGKDEVIGTLDFLEEYVIKHFNDEEELQKKNNYPKYEIQHRGHEEFKDSLRELRRVFETTGISAIFVINVQQKISNWWRKHILELDRDLGNFLRKS